MGEHGTLAIPEASHRIEPSSREDLDAAVAAVAARRKDWVALDVHDRIRLLDRCLADTHAVAADWAARAAEAKGIDPGSPRIGDEWFAGPAITLRNLRLLRRTLEEIRDHGEPQVELRTRPSGQVVAEVLPSDTIDKLLFAGYSAEVWMEPDVSLDRVRRTMAWRYRPGGEDDGGVCFVLGAGNISAIPATDVLYKLFVEDRVCVLKMNPVNEHLGPYLAAAFGALVEGDHLRIVYGGAEQGAYLTQHPDVDELHMTGSDKTHDAIVFGTGDEGRARKERDEPRLDKPFTSELGNVTPIIVVPGPWTDGDVEHQGTNLASMIVHNAGFNCVAGRLIVTHRKWSRRRDLLAAVRRSLQGAHRRDAYYPGARDRWQRFVDAYPQAEWYGAADDGVPWTLVPDVDPDAEDLAMTTEAFCGVIAETPLDAPTSVPEYVAEAVRLCNERVWGSLAATIVVHPRSMKDPSVRAAVEQAIEELRYGTVLVNHWAGLAFGLVTTSWGAFPGHDRQDIQSGTGVVHNSSMFRHPQKSVVRGPFRPPVKPVWFHDHRTLGSLAPKLTALEATQDLKLVPGLLWDAVRG